MPLEVFMTSRRITPGRLAEVSDQLTDRDRLILTTLRDVRVATAAQLQRLWFTDNTPRSNARMTQRRLQRLVSLGLITRLDRAPGGFGGGSLGHVFTLDIVGLRLTAPDGQQPIRRPWPVSRLFLAHSLEVTEWHVLLTEAERSGPIELLDCQAEPQSWRSFVTMHGTQAVLKPDIFVRLARGDWEEHWFLEIDRATEHTPAIRRQLDWYATYWRSGIEQQAADGLFPLVLWIVPSSARRDELSRIIGRLEPESQALFKVATVDEALILLVRGLPP